MRTNTLLARIYLFLLTSALLMPTIVQARTVAAISNPTFHLALVPNLASSDVSILDTTLNQEIARIPVGPVGYTAAMSGDGQFGYVSSAGSEGKIYKINLNSLSLQNTIHFSAKATLYSVNISPDDRWLAVSASVEKVSTIFGGTTFSYELFVYFIDTQTDTVSFSIQVSQAAEVRFPPGGNVAYVPDSGVQKLHVVNLVTQSELPSLPLGEASQSTVFPGLSATAAKLDHQGVTVSFADCELSADGNTFFAATRKHFAGSATKDELRVLNIEQEQLQTLAIDSHDIFDLKLVDNESKLAIGSVDSVLRILDLTTNTVTTLPAKMYAAGFAYDPTTKNLWSQGYAYSQGGGFVEVFNLQSMQKLASIPTGKSLLGILGGTAMTQDGKFFYDPDTFGNSIKVVNTATFSLSATIPVGGHPGPIYMQGDNSPQ